MKTVVIACRTIEDELMYAIRETGVDCPVLWVESGLHNVPDSLHKRLEEMLADVDAERVLLAFGFCGNAVLGLKAGNFEMIVPRADDCITVLLGSLRHRMEIANKYAAYFLTEGWLRGERNIWVEYQYTVKRYGKKRADSIMKMLYSHYRTLAIVDAGVTPLEPTVEKAKPIAETFKLEPMTIQGSTDWLKQLLTGPWTEDRFLVIPPGDEIRNKDLMFT